MSVALQVKWNKQSFAIDCDVKNENALDLLKAQIMSLTNVPVERQKLMVKGKKMTPAVLAKLKKKAKVLMTGSAELLAAGPTTAIKFFEDMTEEEKLALAPAEAKKSAGLNNLGNTCFMNSTLQCLRYVPEFKDALKAYAPSQGSQNMLCNYWGRLYKQMDSTQEPVTPSYFTQSMRTQFPQLGTRDEKGFFQQQDAEECLSSILQATKGSVKVGNQSALDDIFGCQLSIESKMAGEDKVTVAYDTITKLRCFIDSKVNYMIEGLKKGMVEEIEKNNALGVPSILTRTSALNTLPKVLIIQSVRFFWKPGVDGKAGTKSKILRKVAFPEILDVMDLCDAGKKASLREARIRVKEAKDLELGLSRAKKKVKTEKKETNSEAMDTSEEKVEEPTKVAPPKDSSGTYKLIGVITHQGRSADSGHYIGWCRNGDGDDWWKFDDNVVTACTTDEVKKLCGGGDWHTNYVNFYRRIDDLTDKNWEDAV